MSMITPVIYDGRGLGHAYDPHKGIYIVYLILIFHYNRPAPVLLKPVPQRQSLLVVQFYVSVTTS